MGELKTHIYACNISFAPVCVLRAGAFCRFGEKFSNFFSECLAHSPRHLLRGYERGNHHPLSRLRKEVNTLNEPYRTQFEVRCAFNGFCKKALKYEASSAHRDVKRYQKHFVSFSDLSPEEESQLYTVDKPFESEKDDNSFSVGGKRITPELLAEALRTLPEVKRNAVILYYFHDMSDADIAKLYNIPRSTVQHRRTSSFSSLKKFLEERADDETEW